MTEQQDRDDIGVAVRRFLESVPTFLLCDPRDIQFWAGKSDLKIPWRQDPAFDGVAF